MNNRPIYIHYAGPKLLETPLLNKASAFTPEERQQFNLIGLLPDITETIEEQVTRAYAQLTAFHDDLEKHIYLRNIQDTNETLYFRLVANHLEEIMPLIYTPTVGEACRKFSQIYRRHRGLFISYKDRDHIDDILRNVTKNKIKVIVVTDGERILGLGDQGIGGMGIPIGKLALYSACGGISPAYTLPITLDVGCNNQEVLDDPMYMGTRTPRISGEEYDEFIELFVNAVKKRWPSVLLQFEDFALKKATPMLEKYRDALCCFNDDIQGTAAVTVGTLLAACKVKNEPLKAQRFTFMGSGSAGCGIAEQVIAEMQSQGLSEAEARSRVTMLNRDGLVLDNNEGIMPFQLRLAQPAGLLEEWGVRGPANLQTVIEHFKPTVLIGVAGFPGLFTKSHIQGMMHYVDQPIIFPLSNPTSRVEATPIQLIEWSEGKAIVATGSPFGTVTYMGAAHVIAQCNNSYIFPGIGLAVVASKAERVTENMLMASSHALAQTSPLAQNGEGALLPPLNKIRQVSKDIAKAVYKQAIADGVAFAVSDEEIENRIDKNFWEPEYRQYKRITS